MLTIAEARNNAFKTDWTNYTPPEPDFIGIRSLRNYPLEKIVPHIDWTPFFQAWELSGRYPAILQDEIVGEAATTLEGAVSQLTLSTGRFRIDGRQDITPE